MGTRQINLSVNDVPIEIDYFVQGFIDHVMGGILVSLEGTGEIKTLDVSMQKTVMAVAYGDEWTNMLQPFWALALLGITGLKAREIVGYTMVAALAASLVFIGALLIF